MADISPLVFPVYPTAIPQVPPLAEGGGPPHDPGMEARVAKLESDVDHLKTDVADIRTQVRDISNKIGEVATKLGVMEERTKHVATKAWVLAGVIVVLLSILGACWWAAQQYLQPILAKLAS